MRKISAAACVSLALLAPLAVQAQNVATVNGKPVPKARVDTLVEQAAKAGQPRSPELEKQARDEVVMREMFMQEAEKRGLAGSPEYKAQMELARQTILIRELFEDEKRKNPVTDEQVNAEYEKFKAQASGKEYRARHILVENEAEAKKLTAQIKGGTKFEDLAKKHSKDAGSAENGGDLDFAKPDAYVPEFGQAMTKLKKGEVTPQPVKSQFGWHIIKLEDTRDAQFPPLPEVSPQIRQRLEQQQLAKFRDDVRGRSKTDYKFSE